MRRFTVADPAVRRRVEAAVRAVATAHPKAEQSCDYRLDIARGPEKVVVKQYTNGTLFVQGSGSLLADIVATVEGATGVASSPVGMTSKRASEPDLTRPFDPPWVGSDEAGKGDYFGPLVAAAVWVDDRILGLLEAIGARDSKALTDASIPGLAAAIREIGGDGVAVVTIAPARYNVIQAEMAGQGRNLNDLVAWAHAAAITQVRTARPASRAIVDRFADPRHLDAALRRRGGEPLHILHAPRAEANLAVAAASILARAGFLAWFGGAGRRWGMDLPLGASDAVIVAGKRFVAKHGVGPLSEVAKLHFRTTLSVAPGLAKATPALESELAQGI
jgi:ribonuclease HIII